VNDEEIANSATIVHTLFFGALGGGARNGHLISIHFVIVTLVQKVNQSVSYVVESAKVWKISHSLLCVVFCCFH
jgi:hypothetical protein